MREDITQNLALVAYFISGKLAELIPFNKTFHQQLPESLTSESAFKKMTNLWNLNIEHDPSIGIEKCFFDLHRKTFFKASMFGNISRILALSIPWTLTRLLIHVEEEKKNAFAIGILLFWLSIIKISMILLKGKTKKFEILLRIQLENTMTTIGLSKLFKMSSNNVHKIAKEMLLERLQKFFNILRVSIGEVLIAWILPIELFLTSILIGSFIGWTYIQFVFIVLGVEKLLSVFEFKRLNLKNELERSNQSRISKVCEYFGQIEKAKKLGYDNFIFSKLFNKFQISEKLSERLKQYEFIIKTIKIIRPLAIYTFCFWSYIQKGHPFRLCNVIPFLLTVELGQITIIDIIKVSRGIKPAFKALQEIKEFILHQDEPLANYTRNDIPSEKLAISITEGSFSWKNNAEINKPGIKPTLKNLSISIKHGSVTGIIGDSGSGKSSLFYAILGGMNILSTNETKISVSGTTGFVNDNPNFQSCSIRDYILQGRPYDSSRFKRVVRGTTLNKDLSDFPKGYDTDIGETGMVLNSKQKVKIALAQIAYKNADIILFDGVLDLFEDDEFKRFFEDCIMDLFREKTRVIISNDPNKWNLIDYFYILQEGYIVHRGPFDTIKNYQIFKDLEYKFHQSTNFVKTKVPVFLEYEILPKSFGNLLDESDDLIRIPEFPDSARETNRNDLSIVSESGIELMPLNRTSSPREVPILIKSPAPFKFSPEADHEDILRGDNRYQNLVSFIGGWSSFWILLVKLCSSMMLMLIYYSISAWASFSLVEEANDEYLKNFILLCFVYLLTRILNLYQIKRTLSISAKRLHISYLKHFSNCPLPNLFEQIPINTISDSLGWKYDYIDSKSWNHLDNMIENFIIIWATGILIMLFANAAIFIAFILASFLIASRIKTFNKLLRGLVIYDLKVKYERETCFDYSFSKIIEVKRSNEEDSMMNRFHDLNNKTSQNKILMNGVKMWLEIRIAFVGFLLTIFIISQILIFEPSKYSNHISALLLLLLFTLDNRFSSYINSLIELEPLTYSLESCAYIFEQIPTQEDSKLIDPIVLKKLAYWPIDGDIIFKKIKARVPNENESVILKLDMSIKGGQKVAVLANDNKIVQGFFDLLLNNIPYNQGELLLDGLKLSELDSNLIKSKVSIISNDPFMVSGTLKENIDLEESYSKEQIWSILPMIALKNFIQEKGFDFKVETEGRNLTQYEKIAISVIRAILSKNKIIFIEDLDVIMNEKIQKLMEDLFTTVFAFKTVIVATKKFDYLLKFDKILTLHDGKLIDFDSPLNLLGSDSSYFKKLLNFYN